MVTIVVTVVYVALILFSVLMWVRLIMDVITSFTRGFRPRGFVLVIAETAYTVTDPPIRLARRVIRPIRIGGAVLDLAWSAVMISAIVVTSLVPLAYAL